MSDIPLIFFSENLPRSIKIKREPRQNKEIEIKINPQKKAEVDGDNLRKIAFMYRTRVGWEDRKEQGVHPRDSRNVRNRN